MAVVVCLAQQGKPSLIHFFIIHIGLAAAPVCILTFFFCQPSVFDQLFQVDQVRIARKSRKCLIGGIPISGGSQGQDLPQLLSRFLQKIHKSIGFFGKGSDAESGWQAGNR